jgi:hypothetical protein
VLYGKFVFPLKTVEGDARRCESEESEDPTAAE